MGNAGTRGLELGDSRRTQRLIKLVEDLAARPTGSLPVASGGWAETKAAYRLLDNPAVDWRESLEVHPQGTAKRRQGHPGIWGLHETTELDFTRQPSLVGLGRLSDEAPQGL